MEPLDYTFKLAVKGNGNNTRYYLLYGMISKSWYKQKGHDFSCKNKSKTCFVLDKEKFENMYVLCKRSCLICSFEASFLRT